MRFYGNHLKGCAPALRDTILLSLAALFLAATWWSLNQIIAKQAVNAELVNLSARQLMLSQHTALLTIELVNSSGPQQQKIRDELYAAVQRMTHVHQVLTRRIESSLPLSAAAYALYVNEPDSLGDQVVHHINAVQALIRQDVTVYDNSALRVVTGSALTRLNAGLDTMTQVYEQEGAASVTALKRTSLLCGGMTVLLLMLEAAFLFNRNTAEGSNIAEILKQDKTCTGMLLDSVAEGIYGVDMQGNCTFINAAGLRMLGYRMEADLIGKNIHKLIHHTRTDGSHYPVHECPLYACLQSHADFHADEELFWRRDGTSFAVDYWSRSTLLNGQYGAVVTFIDITERKLSEDALRVTASVFDNSQEAIVITDANNQIIDVNAAFTDITGYQRDEIKGKNPKILNSGRQDRDFYVKLWHSLQNDKLWRGEIWNRRKSGEIYAEMLSISAICDKSGKIQHYVAVFSDITQIKMYENELSHVAHYDALTGIPNRLLLADRLKQAIAQTHRDGDILAVCYLDLDGFKVVNDTLGHNAGDQVLIEVSRRIGNIIRGRDTVARLGGDEFVILLPGLKKKADCVTMLDRILAEISQPLLLENSQLSIGASIGISLYPVNDESSEALLLLADQAMYLAKQSGKNRYHFYDSESWPALF
jgi:diguanylate cyclase (GGDEF)-like protein/PAS domain S-box-containing protein